MFENTLVGILISIIVVIISMVAIINAAMVSLRREMDKRDTDIYNDAFKDGYERGKAVRKL